MRKGREKISLEDYLRFFHSNQKTDLTVNYLHQIFTLHGYRKLQGRTKKDLTASVGTLDLTDPSRSTLKDNISSSAIISLDDIIADLSELNWQECCVTSLQMFNSNEDTLSDFKSDNSVPISKPKLIKSESHSNSSNIDGATSSSCTSEIGKQRKKKKVASNNEKPLACVPFESH